MVKQKQQEEVLVEEKSETVSVIDSSVSNKEKTGLKKSTILTGILLLGVAAVWSVFGYQAMHSEGESFLGKYFSKQQTNDIVVATIDGKNVYMSKIKAIAEQSPQLAELPFEVIYPKLVQDYVLKEVILKSAKDYEVQKDPIVRTMIRDTKNGILRNAYLEKRMSEMATPEKLKELYLEELKQIERQDEVHARHILVRTEKEANDILIQLKAGADFKMLANAKSLDAEGDNGGDLGYFQKNMMIPEFGEAVFALKKGQVSAPIKTPFGWHIVLVEDRRLASPPSFDEVQDQLRQLFFERNVQTILEQEIDKHRAKIIVPTLTPSKSKQPVDVLVQEMTQEVLDKAAAEQDNVVEVVEETPVTEEVKK